MYIENILKRFLYRREKGVVSSYAYILLCSLMFIYVHVVQWLCIFLLSVPCVFKLKAINHNLFHSPVGFEVSTSNILYFKSKNVNPLVLYISTSLCIIIYKSTHFCCYVLINSKVCVKCMWVTLVSYAYLLYIWMFIWSLYNLPY